jgi:hypothetical protein
MEACLDEALVEAATDRNTNLITCIEEAQELLELLLEDYDDEEPEELNFD